MGDRSTLESFPCGPVAAPAGLEAARAEGPEKRQTVTPRLRITGARCAGAFYVGGLGFEIDWEHRFEPGFPVFMQLTRKWQTNLPPEHAGDCQVGGAVYVVVPAADGCHREFTSQGIVSTELPEDTPWDSRQMVVMDPDGNRLRFAIRIQPSGGIWPAAAGAGPRALPLRGCSRDPPSRW